MIHANRKRRKKTQHLVKKIILEIAKSECLIIPSVRISTAISDAAQFLLHAQIICYTHDSVLPHKNLILLL